MDRISVTIFQQVIINITLTTRLEVTSLGYGAITIPLTDQLTVEEGDIYGFHFDQTPTGTPFTYTVSQSIQHNSLSARILHRAPPPPAPSGPKFSNSENYCGSENAMPPKLFWDIQKQKTSFKKN